MQKYFLYFLFLFNLLMILLSPISFAAAPEIVSPATIKLDESFTVQASMSGLSKNSIYRLRIALSESDSSIYFGSTYNGAYWYNSSPTPIDHTKYLSVTTDENGFWSGDIEGKVESGDPKYENVGTSTYNLKIGRYTQTGSTATWSNVIQTNLIAVAPTATPHPTPTPTKEPTPTKTPTPAPFKTPTPTPSTKLTVTKTITRSATKSANLSGIPTSVLGANTKTTDKKAQDDKSAKVLGAAEDSRNNFRLIILALGIILLACAILVFLRSRTKNLE